MPHPIKSSRASTKWQCTHTLHSLRWYNSTLMTTLQYTHRFDFVFLEENIRQRNTDQIRSDSTPRFYILIFKYCGVPTISGKHYKHYKQYKLKHKMTLISILATSLETGNSNFKNLISMFSKANNIS